MIKKYILTGLISILLVFGIILSIKCSTLEKENLKLKVENSFKIDSIRTRNAILEKDIKFLTDKLLDCEYKIDSLKRVKQRVIVEHKYILSKDIIAGVEMLKENLRCEK